METRIHFNIPNEVVKEATQLITNSITVLKPWLIALTPTERQTIPKMSDKTFPFVEKTLDYSVSAPQFAPPYMDVTELTNDMKVFDQLNPLLRLATALKDGLDDTRMMAGGESYINALSYYNSIKQATKMDVPGAKSIYEDLKKRFVKNKTDKEEIAETGPDLS